MPKAPAGKKEPAWQAYDSSIKQLRSAVYSTVWSYEYYCLKVSVSAEDFYLLYNKKEPMEILPLIYKTYLG